MQQRRWFATKNGVAACACSQNLYQIVQTSQFVLIYTELMLDARIIRIGGQHAPKNVRFWLGDSVGHWEADTLVVDATNFTAE